MSKSWIFAATAAIAMLGASTATAEDNEWVVQTLTSAKGQEFHYMEVRDEGVTDINLLVHWPSNWAFDGSVNPAVAYVGARAMVGGGTPDHSPREFQLALEDANAYAAVWANVGGVTASIHVPNNFQIDVIPMAVQALTDPQFHSGWVRRTKNTLSQERQDLESQAYIPLATMTRTAILGDVPLNDFMALNDLDQIADVSAEDLAQWHARTFVNGGAQYTVVGPITPERASQWVDFIDRQLPQGQAEDVDQATGNTESRRVYMQVEGAQGAWLNMMFPIPKDDRLLGIQDDMLATLFAGGPDSPLSNAVRTELRATYGLQVGTLSYAPDLHFYYISGEVDPDKLDEVVDVISNVYDAFYSDPDLSDFEGTRRHFADSYFDYLSGINASAETIMAQVVADRDFGAVPKLDFWIDGITRVDLNRWVEAHYPPSNQLMIFATGPNPNALEGACAITAIEEVVSC